jgi:hypothetical protein
MMKNKTIRLILLFGAIISFSCTSVGAEMRVWMDKSGNQYVGEFVREKFGSVTIRTPDRRPLPIKLENLSVSDLEYLRTKILPPIKITARKKRREKERNEDFRRDGDYIDIVTLEVTVQTMSRIPYTGMLRSEVYLVGEEVAESDSKHCYRLSGKGGSRVFFNEENRGASKFLTSAEFRQFVSYSLGETRGADYAGYLVIVFDPEGNRMGYKTDLSWLDEDEIEKLRSFYVGKFFDESCRKRSVPRPKSRLQ